ncbi:hypothetical protein [Streptomyces sp. NPDC087512]|uniref:hypothetical protein n=1 Tax=unclassified Streptomyces TaxID=2593676 RepID=UPI00344099DD
MRHLWHRITDPPAAVNRLITATLLASSLVACSSSHDGTSYTVPDNICGIPANRDVLEALLHDGKKLEQSTGYFTLLEGQFCHMYVDGNDSVVSDGAWHEKGYELRDHFRDYDVKGLRYLKAGEFVSWNNGVATVFPCPGVSEKGDVVSVEVSDIRWNEESRGLLEKLIPSYFDAYKDKLGCRG